LYMVDCLMYHCINVTFLYKFSLSLWRLTEICLIWGAKCYHTIIHLYNNAF
jgi:hypothetical protein